MDADQAFEFDLHGVLVVKGVLDQATVNELRTTMSQKLQMDEPAVQAAGNGTGRVGQPARHRRFDAPLGQTL